MYMREVGDEAMYLEGWRQGDVLGRLETGRT